MGLDLTIMPLRNRRALDDSTVLCYDRLGFSRDSRIFRQITDPDGKSAFPDEGIEAVVLTYSLPPKMFLEIYGDEGLRRTRQNPYGGEMVYTFAEEMRKITLSEDVSTKNKAIMAYVNALEADIPIILEWR